MKNSFDIVVRWEQCRNNINIRLVAFDNVAGVDGSLVNDTETNLQCTNQPCRLLSTLLFALAGVGLQSILSTNRYSCVSCRLAPLPVTMNDLEGHFSCFKPFQLHTSGNVVIVCIIYDMFTR